MCEKFKLYYFCTLCQQRDYPGKYEVDKCEYAGSLNCPSAGLLEPPVGGEREDTALWMGNGGEYSCRNCNEKAKAEKKRAQEEGRG